MTREEINRHINKVPQLMKERYRLCELQDLSGISYEHVTFKGTAYRYYPDIPGVLIGAKLVTWKTGTDMCKIDVHNPEHFEQILRRGHRLQYDDIIGILEKDESGRISARLEDFGCVELEYSASFPIDGTVIYYNPFDFRFERRQARKTDAIVLFLAKRYRTEHMIPFKDTEPDEWGDCE